MITFAGSYEFFFFDPERCARRHPEAPAIEAPPAAAREEPADEEPAPAAAARDDAHEITSVEHEPVALPDFLARKADEARQDEGGEPAAEAEKTMRERLPVALPGVLARRAEEAAEEGEPPDVQKETVDLADIEGLITAEEAAEGGGAAAGSRTTGLRLVVTDPGGSVAQFPLIEGENLVGRGASAQVMLRYPDLSRRHATLTVTGGRITIRDLRSRNRTFVDDAALDPEVDVEVSPGARLRFGSVEARLAKVGG